MFDAIRQKNYLKNGFIQKGLAQKYFALMLFQAVMHFMRLKTPTMTSYTLAEYKTVKRPYLIEYIDSFATPQGAKDTKMPT